MRKPKPSPISSGPGAQFRAALISVQADMETVLGASLPMPEGGQADVIEAMRYAVLGGGKRIRPFILIQSAALFGDQGDDSNADIWQAASALEFMHVYSLIHDDLPAMDDDNLRRGRPTVHRAFDEAVAILAGDALQSLSFDTLARISAPAEIRLDLISRIAKAAGIDGMVGGQHMDMTLSGETADLDLITHMQNLKTGALIRFAAYAGGRLGGADAAALAGLETYAKNLGLLFQVTDDLLDVEGDAVQMGKTARKDEALGKVTFVSILGLKGAKMKAQELTRDAKAALKPFGERANILSQSVDFVLERRF